MTASVCTGRGDDLETGCQPHNAANNQVTRTRESPMRSIAKKLVSFLKREDGPTAVEYAVMLALIVVVCIAAITALGSNANETFSFVGSSVKP